MSSTEAQFKRLIKDCKPEQLQWTALMKAIAMGTAADVRQGLLAAANLAARDYWERTPWLLSIHTGDLAKAQMLWSAAIDPSDRGNCGETALMLAVESGNLAMLQWLLDQGFDVNEVDDFGQTALRLAIEQDAVELVAWLLQAGANAQQVPATTWSNIYVAKSVAVARMLATAGEDFQGINRSVRRQLTKLQTEPLPISPAQYHAGKQRWFGLTNPELMWVDFWRSMVCNNLSAVSARQLFEESESFDDPIWCFDRFGQSLTELPDGRIIEIGGEHEDSYDPDFCIYNDVVVYDGRGNFQIFGYPQAVFPPTDFHTATLVGDYIYIIGRLGYYQGRTYHQTPVYRLDCRSYQIELVVTTGNHPGWIYQHRAEYLESGVIVIRGGLIENGQETKQNSIEYRLDLKTLTWR